MSEQMSLTGTDTGAAVDAARTWSPYQKAVFHFVQFGKGNAVVRAVPGSGKTTTIVEAAKLVPPGKKAAFVAFNGKIAEELKKRLPRGVPAMTTHSFGLRALRNVRPQTQVKLDKGDKIVRSILEGWDNNRRIEDVEQDPYASYDNFRLVRKAVGLAKGMLRHRSTFLDMLDEFELESKNLTADQISEAVLRTMLQSREDEETVDYDDMIWLPCIKKVPVPKFDYIFVDETQDLNASKIHLVLKAAEGGRVIAVGDPRQSIYSFAGADVNTMERVQEALNAEVLPLSVSYRCAKSIVREAQRIEATIEHAEGAPEGLVRTIRIEKIESELRGGDFVVSRLNAPIISLCFRLISQGRPAYVQGREIGASLKTTIDKSKAETVEDLLKFIGEWHTKEIQRLTAKGVSTDSVDDRRACIEALAEDKADIWEVYEAIDRVFADAEDSAKIRLSSVHRAKGLEASRVFVLQDTFYLEDTIEEANLEYVALTRAKTELVYVQGVKIYKAG